MDEDMDTRELVWVTCDLCAREYLEDPGQWEEEEEEGLLHLCDVCLGEEPGLPKGRIG